MTDILALIHTAKAERTYRNIAKNMKPHDQKLAERSVAYMQRERADMTKSKIYRFDRPASRYAGTHSIQMMRDVDSVLAGIRLPPEGVFISFHLDVMLKAVGECDNAMLFMPSDPRDHREAAFLFQGGAGRPITATMWIAEDIPNGEGLVAVHDPVGVCLGGEGDVVPLKGTFTEQYLTAGGLALGIVGGVPARWDVMFGLRAVPAEFDLMASVSGSLDFTGDRAGAARRALALLDLALNPPQPVRMERDIAEWRSPKTKNLVHRPQTTVTIRLLGETVDGLNPNPVSRGKVGEHEVRGFWRTLMACTCEHPSWTDKDAKRQVCSCCGAKRTFVDAHTRGDPSIYVAKKKETRVTL